MHHRRPRRLFDVRTAVIDSPAGAVEKLTGCVFQSLRHHDPAGVHLLQAKRPRLNPGEGLGARSTSFTSVALKIDVYA